MVRRVYAGGVGSSYLASGDELKGPEGGLHVGDVALEIEQSLYIVRIVNKD